MTMINHKFKNQILAKEADLKKLYGIYPVLKRCKDLLFGRAIKINKELGTIFSRHKDSAYLSPLIGKWLVFINCFSVTQLDQENEPKKLLEFLAKYQMIPGSYDDPDQDDLTLLGNTVEADEESQNPRVLPITAPIKLQDTEYAQTIATVIQNIEEHQANDSFCMKTITNLKEKCYDGVNHSFMIKGAKLFKIIDDGHLLVLPQYAQADVILAVHELFLHPGVNKTLAIVQQHFWGRSLDTTTCDIISKCYQCKTSKITNQKVAPKPMHIIASSPGELVCIDIYGPLPKCPGGNMALFVALDV